MTIWERPDLWTALSHRIVFSYFIVFFLIDNFKLKCKSAGFTAAMKLTANIANFFRRCADLCKKEILGGLIWSNGIKQWKYSHSKVSLHCTNSRFNKIRENCFQVIERKRRKQNQKLYHNISQHLETRKFHVETRGHFFFIHNKRSYC